MHTVIKIAVSVCIILLATGIAKRFPAMAGLVSVMPLTSVLILVWIYAECNGNPQVMTGYTKGAIWGMVPSILFFLVALICFQRQWPLPLVLASGFGIWLVAGLVHQWVLR